MKSSQVAKSQVATSLSTLLVHGLVRFLVELLYRLSRVARFFIRHRSFDRKRGAEVLLTGTFHSAAWIMAFIKPLAMADNCRNVVLVTTFRVPDTDGVTVIYPSAPLRRAIGDVPARLLVFAWHAIRRRPLLVGGFHISINALVADLVASLSGSRSMYVCVGGPIEVIDGGLWGESRFFGKLRHADPMVERKLLRTIRRFDMVVPMGASAVQYFEARGVKASRLRKMTGGVDASRFRRPRVDRLIDLIFIGRLVPIKCVDLLLQTVAILFDQGHNVRARIVGQGPMESELRQLAITLGIEKHVEFVGFVPDVVDELIRAKCFVLTSRSEGLSLAMIEAMLAGAVPVVADVGDLSDLVDDGVNGYLVQSREPDEFARCIDRLIGDESTLLACSKAAYTTALRCDVNRVADEWDALLDAFGHR